MMIFISLAFTIAELENHNRLSKKLMSEHPDLQGFYLDEYEDLLESYPLFAQQPGKFIVVGHEYSDEFENMFT